MSFMDFATGALQTFNQNIDNYFVGKRVEEAKKEERDFQREMAEFERETKLKAGQLSKEATIEAAKLKKSDQQAKTIELPGGFIVPAKPGKAQRDAFWSQLYENPDMVKAALNNSVVRDNFIRTVGSYTNMSAVQIGDTGEFYGAASPAAYGLLINKMPEVKKIVEAFEASKPYSPSSHVKDSQIQSPEDRQKTEDNINTINNANAMVTVNSVKTPMITNPVVDKALDVYSSRHRNVGSTRPEIAANFHRRIAGITKTGVVGYQKDQEAYGPINKFYTAADSPLVRYLDKEFRSDIPLGEAEKKEIEDWIQNPKHGFFDEAENRLNADYYKLIAIYSPKLAAKTDVRGQPAKTVGAEMASAGGKGKNLVRDTINRYREIDLIASQAGKTLSRLKQITKRTGTGSDIIQDLYRLAESAPDFITGLKEFGRSLVRGTNLNLELSNAQSARLDKLLKKVDSGGKGVAAAEAQMLKLVLAYQLTSVLQGGTGGRTISDTDVTRTLSMFGGPTDNYQQKMAKLTFLEGLLREQNSRIQAFNNLTDDTNVDQFMAIYKLDRAGLLSFYNLNNFDKDFTKDSSKPRPIGGVDIDSVGKAVDTIRLSNNKNISDNYNAQALANGVEAVLQNGGRAKVYDTGDFTNNPVLVNKEAFDNWKTVVENSKRDVNPIPLTQETVDYYNNNFGVRYNLKTNRLERIEYTPNGISVISTPETTVERPETNVPRGASTGEIETLFNRIFGD